MPDLQAQKEQHKANRSKAFDSYDGKTEKELEQKIAHRKESISIWLGHIKDFKKIISDLEKYGARNLEIANCTEPIRVLIHTREGWISDCRDYIFDLEFAQGMKR